MRHVVRAVAAIRFAWSTRRDLLLESLALRHQLRVLARSNRRFHPSDRLLWLVLRRVWPRWRAALVLVQPATVDRWQRDGFYWCGRRAQRRRLCTRSVQNFLELIAEDERLNIDAADREMRPPGAPTIEPDFGD